MPEKEYYYLNFIYIAAFKTKVTKCKINIKKYIIIIIIKTHVE